MKFIPLHTKNTAIIYKNSLYSSATIIVLVFIILSVMIPVLLVSLLSPYSGIVESRIIYEQPQVQFNFQNLFTAETEMEGRKEKNNLVACSSTLPSFNARMHNFSKSCEGSKYWTDDLDHDSTIDRIHFQQQLAAFPGWLKSFDLVLFFEAKLKHKCSLSPPALLTHHLILPSSVQMQRGTILLKAELNLKQYIEFTCPFPGRNTRTHFRDIAIIPNDSFSSSSSNNIEQFQVESLLQQLKTNPAYFELSVKETYFRLEMADDFDGLRVQLDLDVLQMPVRYHLNVWERLGQFWLYFASFFGISFYVMNKLKDFLFGNHIIRAWEIIPWKKLY